MTIRILLADDHQIMREGLCALIKEQPDLEVVGQAADGRQAIRLARKLAPDVVIMDIAMPGLNGVEATRQIAALPTPSKVIVLSVHADRLFVAQMLQAGACGYVRKGCSFEELTRAVRVVAAGDTYLTPAVARIMAEDYVRRLSATRRPPSAKLSAKERQVLQLIAEGRSTKEIAELLGISVQTVATHRRRIMRKLNAGSDAELTKFAVREGLTPLEP